jgi:hypothetical protein
MGSERATHSVFGVDQVHGMWLRGVFCEEAGGKMTDLKDERWNLRTRKICGSNGGKVHEQILKALGEANVV